MAFDLNYTTDLLSTGDASFQLVKMEGTSSERVATLANGSECVRTISHDKRKRERHVVKDVLTLPADATRSVRTISVHTVIDQALAPESEDAVTALLVSGHTKWVAANSARIQRGEI